MRGPTYYWHPIDLRHPLNCRADGAVSGSVSGSFEVKISVAAMEVTVILHRPADREWFIRQVPPSGVVQLLEVSRQRDRLRDVAVESRQMRELRPEELERRLHVGWRDMLVDGMHIRADEVTLLVYSGAGEHFPGGSPLLDEPYPFDI